MGVQIKANTENLVRPVADFVGIAGSALCALHCLIVPISMVSGQVVSAFVVDEFFFHNMLLFVLAPTAVLAFGIGCFNHKDRWVLGLGAVGLISLTAALTVLHDILGENGERTVGILASGCLIAAHWRNFRLCRDGDCQHTASKCSRY